jgi:hypothetical protein
LPFPLPPPPSVESRAEEDSGDDDDNEQDDYVRLRDVIIPLPENEHAPTIELPFPAEEDLDFGFPFILFFP